MAFVFFFFFLIARQSSQLQQQNSTHLINTFLPLSSESERSATFILASRSVEKRVGVRVRGAKAAEEKRMLDGNFGGGGGAGGFEVG